MEIVIGVLLPFIGTVLGAMCIFFFNGKIHDKLQKGLLGFASGVMVAASVWSLLIPSMDMSSEMGKWAFFPAAIGFLLGMLFLLLMDKVIPHLHTGSDTPEGPTTSFKKNTMLFLAITLHNIPEGMAVGITLAGWMSGNADITFAGAFALSLGIAIQNFPEGAIVSLPLYNESGSKRKSFLYGVFSGIVEPIASLITIFISTYIISSLPYLLSFSAGAMIYVVIEELIPEASQGKHSNVAPIGFALGFVLMMILDVALG